MSNFFDANRARLENFSRVSKTVGGRADYVQGGGGNTSVKLEGGRMAIKASGFCLKDIEVDRAYAVLDYEALRAFYYGSEPADFEDVEKAARFMIEAAKAFGAGKCSFCDEDEYRRLLTLYGSLSHLQTQGKRPE